MAPNQTLHLLIAINVFGADLAVRGPEKKGAQNVLEQCFHLLIGLYT